MWYASTIALNFRSPFATWISSFERRQRLLLGPKGRRGAIPEDGLKSSAPLLLSERTVFPEVSRRNSRSIPQE